MDEEANETCTCETPRRGSSSSTLWWVAGGVALLLLLARKPPAAAVAPTSSAAEAMRRLLLPTAGDDRKAALRAFQAAAGVAVTALWDDATSAAVETRLSLFEAPAREAMARALERDPFLRRPS
jgi:hypothetical protein